jgi:hypothetical protein
LLAGACAVSAVVIGVLACNTPEPAAPDTAVRSAWDSKLRHAAAAAFDE